jgi:hypothetical protein
MKYKTTKLISFAIDFLQFAGLPADKAKPLSLGLNAFVSIYNQMRKSPCM